MPDCDLCQAINPDVDDCTLQRHLHAGQQRVVAASEYAAAVPTIGAFVPGYLLVVPTTHVLSLGQLNDDELAGVEGLAHDLADQLHQVYRRPILTFEYGLNLPAGRRICHGHLHMLPSTADLGEWLTARAPGYEIASYAQVPRGPDTSYITVRDQTGALTCYPVPNDAFPRIRLREVVARLDPQIEDAAWDWQAHPFPELMRATVDDLTTVRPAARRATAVPGRDTQVSAGLDFASLWRRIAADHPERPALIHGGSTVTWRQFDAQAATLAAHLCSRGLGRGDVAALALPNRPEHLVCLAACLRIGVVPANINYRYRARELDGIFTLLTPSAVFLAPEQLTEMSAACAGLPGCRTWIATGPQDLPAWTQSLERILSAQGSADSDDPWASSPDDIFIKCTGGTTGEPAAIRWRVGDLARNLNAHNPWLRRSSMETAGPIAVADARLVMASPLMHGSGQTRALGALCAGGTVITVPEPGPSAIWDTVAHHRADTLAIVGDPLARPLATALHRRPGRWDLSHLTTITSSGAAWSQQVKRSLLDALPHARLIETLGATEATGIGSSIATADFAPATGTFDLGSHAVVLRTDGTPASVGQDGLLAVAAPHPLGVHPTGGLPAKRFRVSDGTTYLLSGDHARLVAERRIVLLGRDSECVNLGGEKVYLPEITRVLLAHPDVQDAAVIPLVHPVRGHTLGALLHLAVGGEVEGVRRYARGQLADFKVPRTIVRVAAIPRTEAGKLDTTAARTHLEQARRAAAPISEELVIAPRAPATSPGIWQHLTQVAEREQLLLESALASLFVDPALDDKIGKALGYPEWPQPLTLLPALAPELANATEDLALYLQASADATAEVIDAVARHHWPRLDRNDPAAVDAVWLLMQHADLAGERRDELLFEATRNVTTRLIDGRHLALLDDRVQSLHGQPQRYGTFVLVRDEEPRFLYPLDGAYGKVDERRRLIRMPLLHDDLSHAYSPITPYGAGRTTSGNRFLPRPGPARLRTADPNRILHSEPVPPEAVPVYLAATLRHRNEIRRLRDSLPAPLHSTSRWLDLDPLTRPSCQFDAGIALNRLAARLCLDDVRRSKVLIAMGFSRRSAGLSVEIGCALAAGIPVIYVGEPSCSFDMLPEVNLVPDVDAAIETALTWTND